jgi:hypothetical protein
MSKRKLSKSDYQALNKATLSRLIPSGGGMAQVVCIRNARPDPRKSSRARVREQAVRDPYPQSPQEDAV